MNVKIPMELCIKEVKIEWPNWKGNNLAEMTCRATFIHAEPGRGEINMWFSMQFGHQEIQAFKKLLEDKCVEIIEQKE